MAVWLINRTDERIDVDNGVGGTISIPAQTAAPYPPEVALPDVLQLINNGKLGMETNPAGSDPVTTARAAAQGDDDEEEL